MRHSKIAFLLFTAVLLGSQPGCSPTRNLHGYVSDPAIISTLKPGVHSKTTVLESLGTPTTLGTFNVNAWYYISRATDTVAFLEEEIIAQQVIALDFDGAGILTSITRLDLSDAIEVIPVERITPTRGRELGILEQLIGNIGRFDTPIE